MTTDTRTIAHRDTSPRHDPSWRRHDLERMTSAELAIRDAMLCIEAMPCDVRLTEAVVLLGVAQNKVADYVDD